MGGVTPKTKRKEKKKTIFHKIEKTDILSRGNRIVKRPGWVHFRFLGFGLHLAFEPGLSLLELSIVDLVILIMRERER